MPTLQAVANMKIVAGQVRGASNDGKDVASEEITQSGFAPGSIAHIFVSSSSFKFTYGDHPILEIGYWLQEAALGGTGWNWSPGDVRVQDDGRVHARYWGFAGSQNRDNPFTFLVNYVVIGENAIQ